MISNKIASLEARLARLEKEAGMFSYKVSPKREIYPPLFPKKEPIVQQGFELSQIIRKVEVWSEFLFMTNLTRNTEIVTGTLYAPRKVLLRGAGNKFQFQPITLDVKVSLTLDGKISVYVSGYNIKGTSIELPMPSVIDVHDSAREVSKVGQKIANFIDGKMNELLERYADMEWENKISYPREYLN